MQSIPSVFSKSELLCYSVCIPEKEGFEMVNNEDKEDVLRLLRQLETIRENKLFSMLTNDFSTESVPRDSIIGELKAVDEKFLGKPIRTRDIVRFWEREVGQIKMSYLPHPPKGFLRKAPTLCRRIRFPKTKGATTYSVVHETEAYIVWNNNTNNKKRQVLYPVRRTEVLLIRDEHIVNQYGESIWDALKEFIPPILVLWVYRPRKKRAVNIEMVKVQNPIPGSFSERFLSRCKAV